MFASRALRSSRSLLSWGALIARGSSGADDARLVGDGRLEEIAVATLSTVLTIVTIRAILSFVTGWSWRPGGALLARAARRSWLGIHDSVPLALLALMGVLLLENGHFSPHVAGPRLAELRLGDQVALEAGHIRVEHGQGNDAGDDGRSGDHNGKEGDAPELAVLVRLILILEDDWLLLRIHLPWI